MEAGEGSSAVEQAVSAAEFALDRSLLKLFNAAVRGDRLQQALEAACQLSQVKSLEGAIKLANHNRQTALADRIAMFLQTRLELEAAEAADQVPVTFALTMVKPHAYATCMYESHKNTCVVHHSSSACTIHMHTVHMHHSPEACTIGQAYLLDCLPPCSFFALARHQCIFVPDQVLKISF